MKEFYFEPSGISYRLNDFQSNRQTLVMIHGLSGSASAWFPFEGLFKEKFNILNIDLIGHGRSQKPQKYENYSIEAHAGAISHLLFHLNLPRFVIVSHSFGTLVALELLMEHHDHVLGAIFLSPTYELRSAKFAQLTKCFADVGAAAIGPFPFKGMVKGRTDYTRFKNSGDWNVRRMWSDIGNTSLRSYFYSFSQIYRYDDLQKWHRIAIPTLIIHGKLDSLVPVQHAIRLHQALPHSELIVLESSDHIIVLNNVLQISSVVEEFMTSLTAEK